MILTLVLHLPGAALSAPDPLGPTAPSKTI